MNYRIWTVLLFVWVLALATTAGALAQNPVAEGEQKGADAGKQGAEDGKQVADGGKQGVDAAEQGADASRSPVTEKTIYIPYSKLREVFEREGRGVFLPYAEFQQLWKAARDRAAPAVPDRPPVPALITEVENEAVVSRDVVRVEAWSRLRSWPRDGTASRWAWATRR
jgi:hypothetical protein